MLEIDAIPPGKTKDITRCVTSMCRCDTHQSQVCGAGGGGGGFGDVLIGYDAVVAMPHIPAPTVE